MSNHPPLILHVIHHLKVGGMENGLVNLINNIPDPRYRHIIVCIEDYSDFRHRIVRSDVEVIALHRSQIGVWQLRKALYKIFRKLRPTIVHSRNMSGLDALLPARLAGVPYCIHSEHGFDVGNLEGLNWKPAMLKRLHSPLVSRYITVSKNLKSHLVERVKINPSKISQIYNGVNVERFSPAVDEGRRKWLPLDFNDESLFLIGTVGRIQPIKDQQTLLRAVAKIIAQQPIRSERLRLVIVGDGPLLGSLKKLAAELNIVQRVFFPGSLDNIPQALQSLDVFVLPSLNEGISNTILEAMACGLPVIATAVGGNVELVEDGINGQLFKPGDSSSLAKLILGYIDDEDLRQNHAQAALTHARMHYSLPAMVAGYQAVYDAVSGQT